MPDLTTVSVSVLAFSVSLISLMLFLSENRKNRKAIEKEAQEALNRAQLESNQIMAQAVKKAQVIVGQAEAEELKLVGQGQNLTEQFERAAQQQFEGTSLAASRQLQEEIQALKNQTEQAQKQYLEFLNYLRQNLDQSHQDNLDLIRQQINGLFERFEQNLASFLTQTEQKTIYSMDLELRATRELINTYKQQQLKIIDENIVAILEKTLALVLGKKLTLNDQAEFINESLERAKVEKFIV